MRRSQSNIDAVIPVPDDVYTSIGCHGEEGGGEPPEDGPSVWVTIGELNCLTSLHDVAVAKEP